MINSGLNYSSVPAQHDRDAVKVISCSNNTVQYSFKGSCAMNLFVKKLTLNMTRTIILGKS